MMEKFKITCNICGSDDCFWYVENDYSLHVNCNECTNNESCDCDE